MMNREKEAKESKTEELQYLFLLSTYSPEFRRETYQFLTKLGVRITIQHGNKAMIGYSPPKLIDAAREAKRFIGDLAKTLAKDYFEEHKFDGFMMSDNIGNFKYYEKGDFIDAIGNDIIIANPSDLVPRLKV